MSAGISNTSLVGCGTRASELASRRVPSCPGSVIRGETIAHVDWLGFTIRLKESTPPPTGGKASSLMEEALAELRHVLHEVFNVPLDAWKPTGRGWFGYEYRINLDDFGLVAFGGAAQKNTLHIEINAQGCARVQDWAKAEAWGKSSGATITRLDLAHDDFEGKHVDIAKAREWYEAGGFTGNGRPPNPQLVDDLGTGRGKTFYVGNRANGKLARIYEKGKQLGDKASPWVRFEVEWRNKSRLIPWEALIRASEYLAGAFPCMRFLSAIQEKIQTTRKALEISYASMVRWLKAAAGPALNVMLQVHLGDALGVLQEVVREGTPKRLKSYSGGMPDQLITAVA